MKCLICDNQTKLARKETVREKYEAEYYFCSHCGFMFIGNPFWLNEAYENPINITDTGYVLRNVYLSRKTLVLFYFLFGTKFSYLDYAGGYGMLARLMRDYGLNFYNDDAYTENLFAKGFEFKGQDIHALSCFECFEHLSTPLAEIEKMLSISKNIFFSTVLFNDEKIPGNDWEYYGFNHGQHVAFYSKKTLEHVAKKYNLYLCTDGKNLHLLSEKKVSHRKFNLLLKLTTFQFDLIIRKVLKSKTVSDHIMLKEIGKI